MNRSRTFMSVGTLALLLLSGCSSTRSGGLSPSTTTPGGADTTGAPDSTPTTDAATTTTTPVDPLLLRVDGIGTHDLGEAADSVMTDITSLLGAATRDVSQTYPVADPTAGGFATEDGSEGFIAATGRTMCWSNGLCLAFGGDSLAALTFTGWRYEGDPAASLHTASGATVNARWADLPELSVDEGGCYSAGGGTTDGGIRADLTSSGVPFAEFDAAGSYIPHLPDPADVTVTALETGRLPIGLYGDC